jgi:hypothetical protein
MPNKKSPAATEKAELSKFWKSFIIAGLAFLITYYGIQFLRSLDTELKDVSNSQIGR